MRRVGCVAALREALAAGVRHVTDFRQRRAAASGTAIIASLIVLLPALALADEVEESHGAHGIPWAKLVFSTINFLIFLFIAVRLAQRAQLVQWFVDRRQRISTALAAAEQARREAEALRAEWQRRLDSLSGELAGILAQARADITAERDQILAAAQHSAETIRRDAKRTADSELRRAQDALRAEVAAQALVIAERLAPQRLTPADQQRFVSEFVQEIAS
jgi:F-type H+-transporting ATPase subunit b